MSDADEREFIRRAQSGDLTARNALVEHNIPFIITRIRACLPPSVDPLEYVSHGVEIFIRCIERFDLSRNLRLTTFSGLSIERRMWQRWAGRGLVAVPLNNGKGEKYREFREKARVITSIDRPCRSGGRGSTMAERLADRDHETSETQDRQRMELARAMIQLAEVDPRMPEILRMRHSGMTLIQVGKVFGLTRERVRQLQNDAVDTLRIMVGAEGAAKAA